MENLNILIKIMCVHILVLGSIPRSFVGLYYVDDLDKDADVRIIAIFFYNFIIGLLKMNNN
jgi:hypothetical protein